MCPTLPAEVGTNRIRIAHMPFTRTMPQLPHTSSSPASATKKSRVSNLITSRKKQPIAAPDPRCNAADPTLLQEENIVLWSNWAYSLDDGFSSVASNALPSAGRRCGAEELRLREELAREIERELEREIMEGILVLVRRLSDLKAKQITREGICDLPSPRDYYPTAGFMDVTSGRRRRGGAGGLGGEGGAGGVWKQACRCSDTEPVTGYSKHARRK